MTDLADVLADAANEAAVLRLHGQTAQAVTLERFVLADLRDRRAKIDAAILALEACGEIA